MSARRAASITVAPRRASSRAVAAPMPELAPVTIAIPADVADPSDVTMLADRAMAVSGRVDVLVNNAGAFWSTALASSSPGQITDLAQVNLLGAMLLTRAVLPGMLARRHGAIISVGSLSGRMAMEPLYSATKYGLRGFSLALRRQLAGTGVSVSLVSPGKIDTAMTQAQGVTGPLPPPEMVARVVADLAARPRREVVVPARHYVLAWLEQLSPGAADVAFRWRGWSPVHNQPAVTP